MVIEGARHDENFEDIMLRENNVRSIINFYSAEINSRLQYWYNISGKRSLNDFIDEEDINIDFIINLFEAINFAYGRISKFLIDPAHIFLTPDSLFLDQNSGRINVYLCFMPFDKDGERDGFSTITECLTDKVRTGSRFSNSDTDENQRMIELIYRLYDISLRDEFCLDRLISEVRKYEETDDIERIEEVPEKHNAEETDFQNENDRESKKRKKPIKGENEEEKLEESDSLFSNDDDMDFFGEYEESSDEDVLSGLFSKLKNKFMKKKIENNAPEKEIKKSKKEEKIFSKDKKENNKDERQRENKNKPKERKEKIRNEKNRISKLSERKKPLEDFDDVDFIYHEDDDINEPTVLLSKSSGSEITGRLIYEGLDDLEDFTVNRDLVKIGSASGNDLILPSNVISRHHAKITREDGQYFIEDLNSTNGTTVNGEMLSYKELKKLHKMDEISFADIVYKIV